MDLALGFGLTLAEMRARMTETELAQWARYSKQKGLPARRLDLLLAQVAMLIDLQRQKAGHVAYLTDYLVGPGRTTARDRMEAEMMAFAPGGIVVRRRGK